MQLLLFFAVSLAAAGIVSSAPPTIGLDNLVQQLSLNNLTSIASEVLDKVHGNADISIYALIDAILHSAEQKLSYFTEDVSLTSYYYCFNDDYPLWMGGDEYNLKDDRRSEYYLFQYQQFLARYYLERLSNDVGEILIDSELLKTAVSDSAFFQKSLPSYTWDELNFDGVDIQSVDIDNLVTYFDIFESDNTNVVYARLNHLPFSFTLHVGSERAQTAVVKAFIGPKYDQYGHTFTYEENRNKFYELDQFNFDLASGNNDIVRKSEDFSTNDEVKSPSTADRCGIAGRLILPKGKLGGMTFQFFFHVVPFTDDNRPFGYPFDRSIDEKFWFTPNMYYYDVNIFHEIDVKVI